MTRTTIRDEERSRDSTAQAAVSAGEISLDAEIEATHLALMERYITVREHLRDATDADCRSDLSQKSEIVIQPMTDCEIGEVSAVIVRALRETNARDYSPEEIEVSVQGFMPAAYAERARGRRTLVAVRAARIVGTAALGQDRINTVFVSPDEQGHGVGRRLMAAVEALAREAGWTSVPLNASRTALGFYAKLGYEVVEPVNHSAGTTPMRKRLVSEP